MSTEQTRRRTTSRLQRRAGGLSPASDSGFGLVEIMVGLAIFAILSMAAVKSFGSIVFTYRASHVKTASEQLATSCMEKFRNAAYDEVGTTGGNPPGAFPANATQGLGGENYVVGRSVSYVNDPLPGGFVSYANYKQVTCTVKKTASSPTLVTLRSTVSPGTQPSRNKATVTVEVYDYPLNTPLEGVNVVLADGPDPSHSAVTPSDGTVVFSQMTPNPPSGPTAFYNLTMAKSGYEVLREDGPGTSQSHFALAPTQTPTQTIRMYKPSTINVHLRNPNGSAYNLPATINVSSDRGAGAFSILPPANGELSVTSVAGENLVPGLFTVSATGVGVNGAAVQAQVPQAYPTNNSKDFTIVMNPIVTTSTLKVTLRDASNNALIGNSWFAVFGGPANVLLVARTGTSGANLGVANYSVVFGAAPYTVFVPRQGIYNQAVQSNVFVPSAGTTSITISVTRR